MGWFFWLFWYVYCLHLVAMIFCFSESTLKRELMNGTPNAGRTRESSCGKKNVGVPIHISGCFCSGWRSNREFHTDPSVVWAPWCKGCHQSYLEAYKATGITLRALEQWIKIEVTKWLVFFLGMIISLIHPFSPSTKLNHRCDCGRKGAKIYQRVLERFTIRAWNLTWHVWLVGAAGWMFGMNLVKLDR